MADNSMSSNHEMLSDYKKVKTESLRFMLENTTFLRDKKDAFLALYQEYKKEKSHERHKELNAMLREYRYDERWLFLGDGELDQIAEIVQKWKTDTDAARESTAAQTQNLSATVTPTSETPKSSSETGAKYSLEVSRGYALEKLGKYNLSISDLQKALTDAKVYTGPINGQFDQATLDAVLAFQKAKNLSVDGLVGIGQTIPALFPALVTAATNTPSGNPVTTNVNAPKGQVDAGLSTVPYANGSAMGTSRTPRSSVTPSSSINRGRQIGEQGALNILQAMYEEFLQKADSVDLVLGSIRQTKEDVQKNGRMISDLVSKMTQYCDIYANHTSPKVRFKVAQMRLELSKYLSDNHDSIDNGHFQDIPTSQNLLVEIINRGNNGKDRIKPLPSGQDEIYAILDQLTQKNPALADKIATAINKYPEKSLYQILSNPTIKGGWESAQSALLEANYAQMDKQIDALQASKNNLVPIQKQALAQLIDLRGKGGWLDLKAEHTRAMWQVLQVGGAVIAGAAATWYIGGVGGIVAGAGVATAGTFLQRGYFDLKETGIDFGINLVSFGGGALVVKVGNAARATNVVGNMGKVGAVSTAVAIDGGGNIGVGVMADKVRAGLHGEDLQTWDSIKANAIPWAIMALVLHRQYGNMNPQTLKAAQDVSRDIENITILQRLGKPIRPLLDRIQSRTSALKSVPEMQKVATEKAFRDMHIRGDALYDRLTKLGGNKSIQIDGLPDGYMIGFTPGKAKIQITTPDGYKFQFYKDKLEDNLMALFRRTRQDSPSVKPTTENPAQQQSASSVSESTPTGARVSVNESVAGVTLSVNQIKNIDTILGQYKKALGKKPGSQVDVAGFTLTRQDDGLVHIKGEGMGKGMVFKHDEAFKYVRSAILNSQEQGVSLIQKALREGVSKWHGKPQPLGSNHELRRINGEAVVYEKSTKLILDGDAEQAILMEHAHKILKGKTEKLLETHGNEKAFVQVGKDSFAFKGWGEWNGKLAWYNPIKVPSYIARWLSTVTLRELIQPVLTLKAFKDALTTETSMIGHGNNLLKAVILRDINPNWISGESFKTVFGRGLLFSAALPGAYSIMHTNSEGIQRNQINPGDALITGGELYYGGLIWGTLLQHFTTDTQPLTWSFVNDDAAVEIPNK